MSKVKVNNAELYYQSVGDGSETILFSHGYLMNNTMFNEQINAMKTQFRCVAYDQRGHGQSEVTEGGYELDNLVTDAIALIEELNLAPVHFVGISAGGYVGMRIALRCPEYLKSLILMDTIAEAESEITLKQYNMLLGMIKYVGWWPVLRSVMPILFSKGFLEDETRKEEVKKWKNIITGHDKKGMVRFGKGIITRDSVLEQLAEISLPTAVIVGEQDTSPTPEDAKRMTDVIPDATFFTIPDAGHFTAIEKPASVIEAMQEFYAGARIL